MKDRLHIFWTAMMIVFLFLAGCWDQRLLRDHGLILSVGYDRADKGDLNTTITYPIDVQGGASGNNQGAAVPQDSKVVTVRGTLLKMPRNIWIR